MKPGIIGSVDLMPASCKAAFARRARVRRWVGVYVITLAALAASYAAATSGIRAQRAEARTLAEQVHLNWTRNEEAQRLLAEIALVEQNIRRYTRLAWPVNASDVVSAVGQALPRESTLTRLTMAPRSERRRAGDDEERSPTLAIELEGVAKSDVVVASIVASFESHPLFATVKLDYARPTEVDGVAAREFRVTATVDLGKRYRFVEPLRASAMEDAS